MGINNMTADRAAGWTGSKSFQRLNPHLFNPEPRRESAGVEREADLHSQIYDDVQACGWLAFHGSMAARTHRTEGEPDWIICCGNGKWLMVECKSRHGKLSPMQAAIRAHAAKLGHKIHVVRSIEEYRELKKSVL